MQEDNCNGPNVALPDYFTSNIHEAYQRQTNSEFFCDPAGNRTRDPLIKRQAR